MALAGNQPVTIINNFGGAAEMVGATSEEAGASGLVPAPQAGDDTKFLRGDGSWQEVEAGGAAPDFAPLSFSPGLLAGEGAGGGLSAFDDFSGVITVQSGSELGSGDMVASLQWANSQASPPPVQVTPMLESSASIVWWLTTDINGFRIRADEIQPSTTYKWSYRIK